MFEGPSPSPSRGQQTSLGDNGNIENQYPSPSFNSSFSLSDDTSHRTPHAVETRNRKQLAVYSEQLQMRKIELQAQARVKAAEAEFVAQRSKMQLQLHTETVAGMIYFRLVVCVWVPALFTYSLNLLHHHLVDRVMMLKRLSLLLKSVNGPMQFS